MKRLLILIAIATMGFSQTSGFGLGAIVVEDFAVSGRYWVDRQNSVNFSVGLEKATVIAADYVWYRYDIIDSKFPLYYGLGAKVITGNGDGFALNAVGGINFLIPKLKFDVFFEVVPTFLLSPTSDFSSGFQFGGRYYF